MGKIYSRKQNLSLTLKSLLHNVIIIYIRVSNDINSGFAIFKYRDL